MENRWRILKKLNMELPCDPASLLLSIYSKQTNKKVQKDMLFSVHCSIIYTSQDMEAM